MTAAPDPRFIDTETGRIFALYHAAEGDARGSVIVLPPFAEEMNMSRRMIYLTARALANNGFSCLVPDLTGTGESDGDFADARWHIWQANVLACENIMSEQSGHAPMLLGLRTGALLAASVGEGRQMIMWQPVGNGETMLNQFLRIRMAAGITGGGEKETTKDLRAIWKDGRSVEVAGYEIHPDLAGEIDKLRLADMAPTANSSVIWVEIGDAERGPTPASQRTIDTWSEKGVEIDVRVCVGEPFWTIQETTTAPAMIDQTLEALGAR